MIRRLALAALLALWPALASAQFATIGPTPATSDNGDRLTTTAWVNNLLAGGISGNLVVNGTLSIGNGELQTNIVAPSTPAAGKTQIYVDSTTKVLTFKNDAGTVGNAVVPSTAVANQFMTGISAAGVITRAQPAFSDISGSNTCAQEPALTGDVTTPAGSCATTLTNAPVIAKVLTGYVSGAGTISAADSILSAFQKINGNDATRVGPLNGKSGTLTFSIVPQVFTASGTYTPTTGTVYAEITCYGAGGGGGGVATTVSGLTEGGGGGAGSKSIAIASAATIGGSQVVTIGTAGTAGTAGANNGGAGGDTSVGAICVGKGGAGGAGAAVNSGGLGGAGGVAGTGNVVAGTGMSGNTGTGAGINTVGAYTSGGGSTDIGGGGTAPVANGAGNAASGPGGGGSGGATFTTTLAGGAGFRGQIYIKDFVIN